MCQCVIPAYDLADSCRRPERISYILSLATQYTVIVPLLILLTLSNHVHF